ncbi:MAG: DUF5103 domain-containing protein [Chitinophagaceae bacterium]|nr:DUF5103 domain-containing protein [Chitinophagaceae bacterium]
MLITPKAKLIAIFLCFFFNSIFAQHVEIVNKPYIQSIRFHSYNNQQGMPLYHLNSGDQLELHFDDMESNVKSYYYTFQLCDYNWNKVDVSPFTYLKGFTQQRITTYRYSSIAFTKYTHYQAVLPERNMVPTLSGNYLLKVFLDGDTSKLVFVKRFLVTDSKALITAQVVQPFTANLFRTHQKLLFTANITGINSFSAAQQVKVVILQNNRWDNAQKDIAPTFVRGNNLEYNSENSSLFAGGKEWRWLDLRSFRFQTDRVDSATYHKTSTDIFVKTDIDRSSQRYVYFADLNGMYLVATYESINPYWQGDYATVKFSLASPNGQPYTNKDIYLIGQLTNYEQSDKTKMAFNTETGKYEVSTYLKQGYYNYAYLAVDKNNPNDKRELEGDNWETENTYTILMYYKAFADRTDQLIGVTQVSTRTDRPGLSF